MQVISVPNWFINDRGMTHLIIGSVVIFDSIFKLEIDLLF